MRHHILSNNDFMGYGVYEHDHLAGMGQLPDLGALQNYTVVGGLAQIDPSSQALAKQALQTMVFTPVAAPELGGESGTASFVLGSFGTPWVDGMVAKGYVVMAERASISTGAIKIVGTDQLASIVMLAKAPPGMWVVVDGHPATLNQARALASGTTPPGQPAPQPGTPGTAPATGCPPGQIKVLDACYPTPPCPAGSDDIFGACIPRLTGPTIPTLPPTQPQPTGPVAGAAHPPPCLPGEHLQSGWCFPPPGGVQPEPGPSPAPPPPDARAKTKLPSWAIPVAVGAGVLGLGALIYAGTRRRSPTMRTNRRRYKAWG